MRVMCENCGLFTSEKLNFCQVCKHRIRDLSSIRVDRRWMPTRGSAKVRKFVETGDPAVFAQPGAPDYNPALSG